MDVELQILKHLKRSPTPTVSIIDEYCTAYNEIFPEVRSYECFQYLHLFFDARPNWSSYTPVLSSWINAFLLAGLLIIATSLIPATYNLWTIIVVISGLIFYLDDFCSTNIQSFDATSNLGG